MTEVEYDRIIGMNIKGDLIELRINYSRGRFSLTEYTGLMYLDRGSAHHLGIIPRLDIEREELIRWFDKNKDRLRFKITSDIEAGIMDKINTIFARYRKKLELKLVQLGVENDQLNYFSRALEIVREICDKMGTDGYSPEDHLSRFIRDWAWGPLASLSPASYVNDRRKIEIYNAAIIDYEDLFCEIAIELGCSDLGLQKVRIGDQFDAGSMQMVISVRVQGFGNRRVISIQKPGIINVRSKDILVKAWVNESLEG